MAPQDDLTAERAALQKFYYSLNAGVEGGRHQEADEQQDIDRLMALLKTARQDALREAKEEIERFIDYSGGCVGTQNDLRVVAVNRFITINIAPLLDRLASEGG